MEADLARQDAQKMFMTAFIEAVKKNISLDNIDDIVSSVMKGVKTDMSLADMVKFAKNVLDTELSAITMMSLPGEAVYSDGAWYFVMNRASVINVMQKHFNVYDKPITDETFDKDRVFCNEDDEDMYALYSAPAEEYEATEHTAQEMSDKDIDIALK